MGNTPVLKEPHPGLLLRPGPSCCPYSPKALMEAFSKHPRPVIRGVLKRRLLAGGSPA